MSSDDPFAVIAERYRRSTIGPRTPRSAMRHRLAELIGSVDAVVVSMPQDDAVFGWDYPALRAWMEDHRLPHLSVSGDPCEPLSGQDDVRLSAFIGALCQRVGTHRV
jgi:hypothetical protein